MAASTQNQNTYEHTSRYAKYGVEPLWEVMHSMVPKMPGPQAQVAIWRYKALRPVLEDAGRTVTAEEAERRVLMLKNPALASPRTTDTLYAGLQLILPGETAPAHRHQSFALRFIIEGSGGFTAVNGEKVRMEQHDMILTPQWQWHDHGHEGTGPMIWLDGLDLPLYHFFPTHFAEPYHEPRYPSKLTLESSVRFPWSSVKAALDAEPGEWARQIYRTETGQPISKTLGAHAEKLNAGVSAQIPRESCSFVYHVVQGSGKTEIELSMEGREGIIETVEWMLGDTFAVPAWSKVRHYASPDNTVYFFVLSDRPALESLDMYLVDGAK